MVNCISRQHKRRNGWCNCNGNEYFPEVVYSYKMESAMSGINVTLLNLLISRHIDEPYWNPTLQTISLKYMAIHGYLSLIVCFFGIPTNIINITVLTRRHMQTPINCILTSMAVFDILTMCSYVPFALHFYCYYPPGFISDEKNSYGWMSFLVFHVNFSATVHTISIWLGVSLAIFRFRHIQSPAKGSLTRMRRLIRARLVVFVIIVSSVILLIPNYMSNRLVRYENTSTYVLHDLALGTPNVRPVVMLNLTLYSSLAKLFPCILMIVYGSLLLKTVNRRFRVSRPKLVKNGVFLNKSKESIKTTTMLLTVMVLFLLTEFPQGILIILSIMLEGFFDNVYIPLGDAMDILALVNNAVNFVLYCSMSGEFRRTLLKLVCTLRRRKSRNVIIDFRRDRARTTWFNLK